MFVKYYFYVCLSKPQHSRRMNANTLLKGFLILFTLLAISCNNKKEALPSNVIPVASTVGTYSILNLSDYVSDIKYIPLETTHSVLIGANPRISYENGHILISNSQNAYLFDSNGKFNRKIGKWGEGPYEYLSISQAIMHENSIFIKDSEKVVTYDMEGNPIARLNLWTNDLPDKYRGAGGTNVFPLKKDTFVSSVISLQGNYPKAILFETHPSGAKMIKEYPGFLTLDKQVKGMYGYETGFIYRFHDEVRTYKGINDTVFSIGQNTEMYPAFIFNLGEYKAPLAFWEWKERGTDKNYIFLFAIHESLNYLFIEFDFGNHTSEPITAISPRGTQYTRYDVYGIFDKRTGEFVLMRQPVKGKLGLKNDVDNGPIIWPSYITPNDELVSLISPEEFMEYYENNPNPSAELTGVANRLELDDNPIVIVAKLKPNLISSNN